MAQKVTKLRLKREKGWLYYLDKKGDISRAKMARGGGKHRAKKPEKVVKVGMKREEGYLYFIDKGGDLSRVKMLRGGKRR